MGNINDKYNRAFKKSVGKQYRFKINGRKYQISEKNLKKIPFKILVTIIILMISLKIGSMALKKINHQLKVKEIVKEKIIDTKEMLAMYGIDSKDIPEDFDYSQIENLSNEDLYGLFHYLDYEKSENFVKCLGYNSWGHFLKNNGYVGEYGQGDIEVWLNYTEVDLLKEKEANNGKKI